MIIYVVISNLNGYCTIHHAFKSHEEAAAYVEGFGLFVSVIVPLELK